MNRSRWLSGAVLVLALLAVTAAPARAASPATAVFVKQSTWPSGYTGAYTVTNGTSAPLTWRVEFDLPAGTSIANSWSALLTRTGDHYAAVGTAWNATLAAGASTTFGLLAQGTGGPLNCRLNGGSCTGATAPPDIRPPTQPGNLRAIIGTNTLTLRWDASADDVAVTAYEVYSGASLLATVTGTEDVMPTPPPWIVTYRVRALDAAGNASPYAMITPGGPPDTVPPAAPTGLLFAITTGPVLSWTAATDNVGVAGYDVTVNGEHYGATSATTLSLPPIGYGGFTFTVVAFDGAGLRSAPLTRAIAIDPGPNSDARPPAPPADLRVAFTTTQVTWSWTAATDNVAVAGYEVFHGTDWAGSVTTTSVTEARRPGQTTFSIRVRAFDAAGNKSGFTTATVVVDPPAPG